MGVDRKHSQTHQNEWKPKGWCNSARLPARCTNSPIKSFHPLLNTPQVPGKPGDDSSALAEHRSRVYHKGLLEILRSVISAAGKDGFAINRGTAYECVAHLIISILSMDYEEG